jgi:hypothetical protein
VTVRGGSGKLTLTATVSASTARKANLGGRTVRVASGSASVKASRATARLRFTATAAKRLTRLRTLKLTVTAKGAKPVVVTLKR